MAVDPFSHILFKSEIGFIQGPWVSFLLTELPELLIGTMINDKFINKSIRKAEKMKSSRKLFSIQIPDVVAKQTGP